MSQHHTTWAHDVIMYHTTASNTMMDSDIDYLLIYNQSIISNKITEIFDVLYYQIMNHNNLSNIFTLTCNNVNLIFI